MHKLVILIEPMDNWQQFEANWPDFLHLVEDMPGLQQEASCRVERFLYGGCQVMQVHELFFQSFKEAENAMASPKGIAAGELLQQITGGRMTIFIADHKQDNISNIQKHKSAAEQPN